MIKGKIFSKRAIATVLTCSVLLTTAPLGSVFSINAYAATEVEENAYNVESNVIALNENIIEINNKDELFKFVQLSQTDNFEGKIVILKNNINLNGNNWVGIGNAKVPFEGTFDGAGYEIQNLALKSYADGFFNVIGTKGIVKNMGIAGKKINMIWYANIGSIAGVNNGVVRNCYNKSDMYATDHIGGIVAYNNGVIENSYILGNVDAVKDMGGITLKNNGVINNCYSTAEVGWGINHDAIACENQGTITNTYWNRDNERNSSCESVKNDVVGMNTSEMKNQAFVDKLNSNAKNIDDSWIWIIGNNNSGYPELVKAAKINVLESQNGIISIKSGESVVQNGDKIIANRSITITATPDKDYELVMISVDGKTINNGETITVNNDTTIYAQFKKIQKTINIVESEFGDILVNNNENLVGNGSKVDINSEVIVSATPKEKYKLDELTVNGQAIKNGEVVVITSDTVIEAKYSKIQKTINIDNVNNGVIKVLSGEEEVKDGSNLDLDTEIKILATANEDYELVKLLVNGKEFVNGNTLAISEPVLVTAEFKKIEKTINIASSDLGTITVMNNDELVESGSKIDVKSEVVVTAKANDKYELVELTVNGEVIKNGSTIIITEDTNIQAKYKKIQKEIIIEESENGSIEVISEDGNILTGSKVDLDTELKIVATPNEDYELVKLLVNGEEFINGSTIVLSDVINVCAEFKKIQKTISINSVNNGSITVTTVDGEILDGDKIDVGTELTITADVDNGYNLYFLDVNGKEIVSGETITVTEDMTISADVRINRVKAFFAKPSSWKKAYIYVYTKVNGVTKEIAPWPGVAMEDEGNGLYSYTLPIDWTDAKVIFSDNGNNNTQIPGRLQTGLTLEGVKIYENGKWTNYVEKESELVITSLSGNRVSPQPVGRDINLKAIVKGGKDPYNYVFKVNGEVIDSLSNGAVWCPEEIGTYNIEVEVSDRRGNTVTETIVYEIKDKALFQTTILYKGYTNPYIKYRLGNGKWIDSPGLAMAKSETKEGYYEVTIELDTEGQVLEACFTDGKGNWDSKNGSNYNFKAGKFLYQSGNIIEVIENQENITKIYYKGFEVPFIHYLVAGEKWTEAPGVKMEKSLTMEGYYEITIDLGDVTNLQACFTDGKGNWDNNGGKNYSFGVGEFIYQDGKIATVK